ncbi:hypothetical protein J2X54_002462 [Duganella sp. 3397]|uniref:hypothetical protein n=1 Tax=Duganella sp. 3397 TaxID=2817732 RepID=UPI00285F4F11|nr:hypothetical protein [Duganella sp. 3397]MDR7050007.1 hypothetical protein [Duganella sp. 3397]
MSNMKVPAALHPEAIFSKSKEYIRKALLRKEGNDLDEYQLWSSLALELLGKAALAKIHPSLIADPTHAPSLFAAAGHNLSTDVKTIAAHTLFERLRTVVPRFDERTKKFCSEIALRRNAELHSGETPFKAMRLDAWEAQYWHAAQIILEPLGAGLDDWLGASQSESPKALLRHSIEARRQAVAVRVERSKEDFLGRKKADQKSALDQAASRHAYHYRNLFTLVSDNEWGCECPACTGLAFMAGVQINEEVVDTYGDEDGAWESVETTYSAEQFHCPVCDLFLDGGDEIEAAGLDTLYSETSEREMEYEPEYGND